MIGNYDIFISYRREGGYDTAKHINDLLVRDGYRVSFDIDTLRSGDYDIQLYKRIDQCKDFILIVDQHAFDKSLNPNFNPQKDWLRCELAYALSKNKNIIPVFLASANGFPDGLPNDIKSVTQKNGLEHNRYYFDEFYTTLKKRFLTSKPKNKLFMATIIVISLLAFFTTIGLWTGVFANKPTNPSDFPNREKIIQLLQLHAKYIETKNYDGLNKVYAENVLRYHDIKKTISRQEVIQHYQHYSDSFGAYGMHPSYRFNTLDIKKATDDAVDVTCILDYSINRVDKEKPNEFVLKQYFVINNNYQILSIYDEKLKSN